MAGRGLVATGLKGYTRYLRDRSVADGLFRGDKSWLAIGAVLWGIRGFRKATKRSEQVLLREVLAPGEQYVIAEVPRKPAKASKPSRRQRRKARGSA